MMNRQRRIGSRGSSAGRRRAADRRVHWRRRLGFEPLEDRRLLATITVNTLVDENNGIGTGGISLREAVAAAATNDTINFSVTGTINLTSAGSGHIIINKSLIIQGPGASVLTIKAFDPDANGNNDSDGHRVFYVSGSGTLNVTISGLTLTNGDPDIADEDNSLGGGAIHNEENLSLIACVLTGNFAKGGGAIASTSGILSITDCIISGNDGARRRRPHHRWRHRHHHTFHDFRESGHQLGRRRLEPWSPDYRLFDSTISGNSTNERGGGLYSYQGSLTISNSTISGNTSDANDDQAGSGGGIFNYGRRSHRHQ